MNTELIEALEVIEREKNISKDAIFDAIVNSIYTADTSDSAKEGIHFYRSATTVDSIHANSGVLYFTPNRTLGQNGTSYKVYHMGNITRGTGTPSGGSNGDIYIQYK